MQTETEAGREAKAKGLPRTSNPYLTGEKSKLGTPLYSDDASGLAWNAGYDEQSSVGPVRYRHEERGGRASRYARRDRGWGARK